MLTKGNCQPKGNSEQQPDANRTLASDAAPLNEDARMLTGAAKLWEAWHLDTWKGSQTYQETDTRVDFHGR